MCSRRDYSVDSEIDDWIKIDVKDSVPGATIDSLQAAEAFHRKQLYLLVARCISYAFNTKHQIETSPPKQKLNADRFRQIMRMMSIILSGERHRSHDTFLTHQEQVTLHDQGFLTCLSWFVDTLNVRPEIEEMCVDGQFSVKELESIFSARAKKQVSLMRAYIV